MVMMIIKYNYATYMFTVVLEWLIIYTYLYSID